MMTGLDITCYQLNDQSLSPPLLPKSLTRSYLLHVLSICSCPTKKSDTIPRFIPAALPPTPRNPRWVFPYLLLISFLSMPLTIMSYMLLYPSRFLLINLDGLSTFSLFFSFFSFPQAAGYCVMCALLFLSFSSTPRIIDPRIRGSLTL